MECTACAGVPDWHVPGVDSLCGWNPRVAGPYQDPACAGSVRAGDLITRTPGRPGLEVARVMAYGVIPGIKSSRMAPFTWFVTRLRRRVSDAGVEEIVAILKTMPHVAVEAEVFRGRAHQARAEFAAARRVLEAAIQAYPLAFTPRLVLSHVLLQEGRDMAAAERALRAVLAMDPGHAETRQSLDLLLLRQQVRKAV